MNTQDTSRINRLYIFTRIIGWTHLTAGLLALYVFAQAFLSQALSPDEFVAVLGGTLVIVPFFMISGYIHIVYGKKLKTQAADPMMLTRNTTIIAWNSGISGIFVWFNLLLLLWALRIMRISGAPAQTQAQAEAAATRTLSPTSIYLVRTNAALWALFTVVWLLPDTIGLVLEQQTTVAVMLMGLVALMVGILIWFAYKMPAIAKYKAEAQDSKQQMHTSYFVRGIGYAFGGFVAFVIANKIIVDTLTGALL